MPHEDGRRLSKQTVKRRAALNAQSLDVLMLTSQSCERLGQRRSERGARAGQVAQVLWMHSVSDGNSDPVLHVGRQLQEWREPRCAFCVHPWRALFLRPAGLPFCGLTR